MFFRGFRCCRVLLCFRRGLVFVLLLSLLRLFACCVVCLLFLFGNALFHAGVVLCFVGVLLCVALSFCVSVCCVCCFSLWIILFFMFETCLKGFLIVFIVRCDRFIAFAFLVS